MEFLQGEDELVATLVGAGASQRAALAVVGISRSSWHYRHHPRQSVADPVPQAERFQPTRLAESEWAVVVERVRQGWQAGRSVFQSFHDHLDAGDPLCSLSSWYRIARTLDDPRPARRRRSRPASAMPQWDADGPNQVWCWDITKLPHTYRGQSYSQYTIIDAFSRLIIANRVETRESDQLAVDLFEHAATEQGCQPRIVHSDGGSAMTSKLLTDYYRHAGILPSRNRPRVSNDNPFSESWFKTEKYRHDYPPYFTSLEQARAWTAATVTDYNTRHHHSALAGFTPHQVHHGTWTEVHARRQATLDQLYQQHPERYHGTRPQAPTPPHQVALNPD